MMVMGSSPGSAYIGAAADFVIRRAPAGRLADYASGEMQGPQSPNRQNWGLEKVYSRGAVGKLIDDLMSQTFGDRVILDRANVPTQFRVGDPGVEPPPLDNPTDQYREAMARLPTLDTQGDGLRSFVGLATLLLAMRPQVALVDEPEAFLHPGQARAVGRWLSRAVAELDLQLLIATHDRDLLLGLMSEAGTGVNVVRIARDSAGGARLHQLPKDELDSLWQDPVLRYSNVLQGLFHRRVVICESDGDCRFFAAALDVASAEPSQRAAAEDTLFVPSGGKHRAATLARSLERLGVPTAVIADFDVLQERATLRGIVEAVGGLWGAELDALYVSVASRVNSSAGGWAALKNAGVNAFPSGASYSDLLEMLGRLEKLNVLVISVGEMEDLNKSIGVHGGKWVTEALAAGTHTEPAAANVVRSLVARERG
jgi:hypothetical protein